MLISFVAVSSGPGYLHRLLSVASSAFALSYPYSINSNFNIATKNLYIITFVQCRNDLRDLCKEINQCWHLF